MKRFRKGTALIVVLGALTLLALLATTFAAQAALERSVARNFLDATRARMLAESGVAHALALLRGELERGTLMNRTSIVPILSGRPESGTYRAEGDTYSLRVLDGSGQINVNDGTFAGPDHSVSRNLRRILNILGAQPSVGVERLGNRLLDARPARGFTAKADLLSALDHDREAFGRVRDFLTVDSWRDTQVANPVPLSRYELREYPVEFLRPPGPIFRYGHQKNFRGQQIRRPLRFGDPVWGRDSLNPQWIEIVSRSPVNVNTAPREVLMALLTDLEGFFLLERPRKPAHGPSGSPCRSPGGAYEWTSLRYTYDFSGDEGDECGIITRTRPLVGPGSRWRDGVSASAVVEEILACREGLSSPLIEGLNYGRAPFGGTFGSWDQFNRFVGALVRGGVLADPRGDAAAEALGDVLKANFNPNLHLNELNPDRVLYTRVDKTDLIVHSTEFSFTPMGTFEIRSTGGVAGPDGGDLVAEHRVDVTVRLFDAIRRTTQSQFARGEFAPRRRGPETNNNRSVECGPEPDNGPAPLENGYEGYLQLPTYGSNFSHTTRKPAGELWTTLTDPGFYPGAVPSAPGGRHLGSRIHAHFQLDHAAHYHAGRMRYRTPPEWDGFRLPQGGWQTVYARRCNISRNWPDRTESFPGPYGPVDSGRVPGPPVDTQRFRLARSFTADAVPTSGFEAAPSDLRIDGAYAERHSAFGYWIDESVSFNFNEGAAAFWLKPAFFPRSTGKRRTLLSLGRYHAAQPAFMNPSPFALFFVPPSGGVNQGAPSYVRGVRSFPPSSLAFGFGFSTATGYNWELMKGGVAEGGPPEKHATSHAFVFSPPFTRDGVFDHHRWVHIAVTWDNPRNTLPGADTVRLYVNGRILPGTRGMNHVYAQSEREGQPFQKTPRWTTHSLRARLPGVDGAKWCKNAVRLGGEPSMLFDLPGDKWLFPGNYSADATLDEFYLWLDRSNGYLGGLWGAQTLWNRGRYYRPDDENPEDARFVSEAIDLGTPTNVYFPPASREESAPTPRKRNRRILGVSWTAYAETRENGHPAMLDHSKATAMPLVPDSVAEVHVRIDGLWHGPFRQDRFSPVRSVSGVPPVVKDPAGVRYSVKLKAGTTRRSGAVLLASPVVDDVTLYFDSGRPRILSWGAGE